MFVIKQQNYLTMKKLLSIIVFSISCIGSGQAEENKYSDKKIDLISENKNSLVSNDMDNQSIKRCIPKKSKIKTKSVLCISEQDIQELGNYQKIENLPKGMIIELGKSCSKESCIFKKAAKKMYRIFVQRTKIYHSRYPGEMVKGMAWYELYYLGQLKKSQKIIEKFNKLSPEKKRDYNKITKKIDSLIKSNKGRKKMRAGMGMSLDDDFELVIKKNWMLGEFLNNNIIKAKKIKQSTEIKKRKLLLEKYKNTLKKYKSKLEEEKNQI